ncbi:MAG: deoxyribodipyrimidine photolyase [Planctomycetota bacterium]
MTTLQTSRVPALRVRALNERAVRPDGDYVLLWMTSARRATYNYALDRALEWCWELNKPLVVFEALRAGYRWASDRLHGFVIEGMRHNARAFDRERVTYYPYLEPEPGAGKGLLQALGKHACVAVVDEFPCFFLPRMHEAAAAQLGVLLESVDTNGLVPLRAPGKVFARAFDFRRWLQKHLPEHLEHAPKAAPFQGANFPAAAPIPDAILKRWAPAWPQGEPDTPLDLGAFPIDHDVAVVHETPGGSEAAAARLEAWLARGLPRYHQDRNQPEEQVASGLSPYLHFGHLSAHAVFAALVEREGWSPDALEPGGKGQREGWWRMSPEAEGFLDELITWRELGYNMTSQREDYADYGSLPDWARQTLEEHARDPRDHVYTLEEFERGETQDSLWNAAQTQLRREGVIHNYLRMLWGKKVFEWSKTPQAALEVLIELNNKYALDGRNPNSYSGIFWCLGRYDRAWGPERPVYGKIRYMSSDNTRRKVRVKDYVARYTPREQASLFPGG